MSNEFTLSTTVAAGFPETLEAVRAALALHGFGIVTEIDMAATLEAKVGAQVEPLVILGACRPQLALEALRANPSVAAVLPCNVVVRSLGETSTLVEAFDPDMMARVADDDALAEVAADARTRILATLTTLTEEK